MTFGLNTMASHLDTTSVDQKQSFIAKILALIFTGLLLIHFLIISIIFSWADWVATLVFSMLLIVPAYLSNAGMVLLGGGKPIDAGKTWKDGRRILGDHKTWNGFIKGPLFIGIPISIGIFLLFLILWPFIRIIPIEGNILGLYKLYSNVEIYQFYFIGGPFPLGIIIIMIRIVFCSYGAAIGDLVGSFLKRRFNIASGKPMWLIDQLDFIVFAILLSCVPYIFFPEYYFLLDVNILVFILILTPAVSVISNTIAYLIGLKEVPW
ncbi:MAG: CDP-2,3-bis-(O-geranylgeranyl)-sn-glycerol synthase [Candidatus Hermodarchaeota archaeon]